MRIALPIAFCFLMDGFIIATGHPLGDPFSDPDHGYHLGSLWHSEDSEGNLEHHNILDWDGEGPTPWQWMRGKTGGFAGWINPWQEGVVDIMIEQDRNITIAHRPAAFPSELNPDHSYPVDGILRNITAFPQLSSSSSPSVYDPMYACEPLTTPLMPFDHSADPEVSTPKKIALVVRGHCSFSHKVRVAQARGASAVLVADDVRRIGELDVEGRERDGLLTMYSPDDTGDITIPSSFISRASYLLIRDLHRDMENDGKGHGISISIKPDDGYDWPLTDILFFIMLLPTLLTVVSLLVGRYRQMRHREAERAPPMVVLSLPETVWTPEEWEKEDSPPPSVKPKPRSYSQSSEAIEQPSPTLSQPVPIPASSTKQDVEGESEHQLFSPSLPSPPLASTSASPRPVQIVPNPAKAKKERKKFFHGDECSICLNQFERGDHVRILPCGHLFHKIEVDNWLLEWKKLCPVCRMDVTQPLTEAALSASASTTTTPLGSTNAPDGLRPQPGQGRYARLRGFLPFQRLFTATEEGTAQDNISEEGRESQPRDIEANERTALLRTTSS